MKKRLLVLGIILAILLVIIFSGTLDFVSAFIPGWNTTIYPRWFILLIIAFPIVIIVLAISLFKRIIKRK